MSGQEVLRSGLSKGANHNTKVRRSSSSLVLSLVTVLLHQNQLVLDQLGISGINSGGC